MTNHESKTFMDIALKEAKLAASRGDVPVGAVIVCRGEIVAKSGNIIAAHHDPTGHAEIIVIREAARILGSERLTDCDLYVTLEPCTMCAGAISHARIRRLYYGAADEKGGGVDHGARFFTLPTCHHRPEVYSGFQETESQEILRKFFQQRRN